MRNKHRKHNAALTPRAKELRKPMTQPERRLWHRFLKDYRVRFLRQKVIDRFIVDFYCASAKLVIELDGSQHFEENAVAYDSERTAILEGLGLKVIRFMNQEVELSFRAVCWKIENEVNQRINPPASSGGTPL